MTRRILVLLAAVALAVDAHAQSFPNPPVGTPYAKHGSSYEPNAEETPAWVNCTNCSAGGGGDATAANQTTGNASLSSIDTKLSSQATAANQTTTNTNIGATNESAASTDTATSGLNGRLQRIAQRLTSLLTTQTDGTQIVKGIPAPCASAPLTKLYQTTASRRSMTISLGATYTWAVVTNLDTTKQVGIRLSASDTDPYVIPGGASMPTIYPAAGVANLYADTSTTPTSGGSTTYLSIYACP